MPPLERSIRPSAFIGPADVAGARAVGGADARGGLGAGDARVVRGGQVVVAHQTRTRGSR